MAKSQTVEQVTYRGLGKVTALGATPKSYCLQY